MTVKQHPLEKQRIIQYQSNFDRIAHFINNEDNSEQVEKTTRKLPKGK